jgi:hypothetical protein
MRSTFFGWNRLRPQWLKPMGLRASRSMASMASNRHARRVVCSNDSSARLHLDPVDEAAPSVPGPAVLKYR